MVGGAGLGDFILRFIVEILKSIKAVLNNIKTKLYEQKFYVEDFEDGTSRIEVKSFLGESGYLDDDDAKPLWRTRIYWDKVPTPDVEAIIAKYLNTKKKPVKNSVSRVITGDML